MAAKQKQTSPRRGDLFELVAPDGRLGYGLVVEGGGCPYIILFRGLHESRPAAEELVNEEIALVGWTMDSWFYHGRWMVMGKLNPDQVDVPYPTYVVGVNGELHATDYKGKVLRPLRPEEEGSLDYKSSRSPIGFQNAFLALHGYRKWDAADDKLTAEHARHRMTRKPANVTRQ